MGIPTKQQRIYFFCRVSKIGNGLIMIMDNETSLFIYKQNISYLITAMIKKYI